MSTSNSHDLYEIFIPSADRDAHLTYGVLPSDQKGLEVGALNNPIVKPSNGCIKFIDYADTQTLKARHAAYPYRVNNMVNVDFVWQGTGSLAAIVGKDNFFDYFIASHVIEHVPNVLGWFRGIAEVLKPGGVFNLAIPDKRFTFDVGCPESTLGQLVEADLMSYTHPSIRQMFDNAYYAKAIEPGVIWASKIVTNSLPAYSGEIAPQLAYDQAVRIANEKLYFDSHCWIFTPYSFLKLLEGAIKLGLFSFEVTSFFTTKVNDFEFFISLKKTDLNSDLAEWESRQLLSISNALKLVDQQQWEARLLSE